MAIRRDEVERIADLSRLRLSPEQLDTMAGQLSSVLEFVAALNRLDLSASEPGTFASSEGALRSDVVNGRRLGAEIATREAPESEDGFFLVPPIVENLNP